MKYFEDIQKYVDSLALRIEATISINWSALLCLSIFWIFAINGYPIGSGINNKLLNLIIVFFYLYFLSNYSNPIFQTKFKAHLSLSVTLLFFGCALIISWPHLNQPLTGDQVYHSSQAARHGQLAIYWINQKAPFIWPYIQTLKVSQIVMASNLVLIFALGALFFWMPRLLVGKQLVFVFLMTAILIGARHILSGPDNIFCELNVYWNQLNSFGLSDPHPLLRLLPLAISSAFFGATDFSFRFAAFFSYFLFLVFLYLQLRNHSGWLIAIIATLSIGTIPIFWHVAYLAEQSIWAAIASSAVFTILYTSKKLEDVPVIPITALAIIATTLRSPAFIVFVPIALIIAYRLYKKQIKHDDEIPLMVLIAMLSMLILISAAHGSPATETTGLFSNWQFSESNNFPAVAAASVIGIYPLLFIGSIFRSHNTERATLMLASLLFFAAACFLYYAPIRSILWGVPRYQAEIFIPLITAGIVAYCVDIRQSDTTLRWLHVIPLALLILVNTFSVYAINDRTFKPLEAGGGQPIKAEFEYPINEAFAFLRSKNLLCNTYYIGVYYGGFTSALRGYTADEYLAFSMKNSRHRRDWNINLKSLNNDMSISAVIAEPEFDSGAIDELTRLGWIGRKVFTHQASGTKLILLARELI